jgi:hypothetical protein
MEATGQTKVWPSSASNPDQDVLAKYLVELEQADDVADLFLTTPDDGDGGWIERNFEEAVAGVAGNQALTVVDHEFEVQALTVVQVDRCLHLATILRVHVRVLEKCDRPGAEDRKGLRCWPTAWAHNAAVRGVRLLP